MDRRSIPYLLRYCDWPILPLIFGAKSALSISTQSGLVPTRTGSPYWMRRFIYEKDMEALDMNKYKRTRSCLPCLLLTIAVAIAAPYPASAQGEADFKGKTVRIVVGTATGGGFDLYARLVAQFLGKHLPGEPMVVVQNMPGGS